MQFHSLYFIIFFLPATLLGYYLLAKGQKERRRAAADWFLIVVSFLFYGFANPWYPVMLGALILLNWGIARRAGEKIRTVPERRGGKALRNESLPGEKAAAFGKTTFADVALARDQDETAEQEKTRRRWMILGVVLNVFFLGFFKYTNFFLENLNAVFHRDWPMVHLILPLGISFIIFSQTSWIVDVWKGEVPDVSFREYVLFSAFFPKITQGPITTMREFLPQLRKKERFSFDSEGMVTGIQMFTCGLFKKVILADPLGTAVTQYYTLFSYRSNVDSLVVMLAYTFQIYFDFSGYSDMAIGLAKMLGFDLPANFNSPYRAGTVTDFWRRWHISLTSFLREYIYFPLGGSRKGKIRTYVNIMIVYLVSGIWHGANWTFVLWGIFHGLAQVVERLLNKLYQKVWLPIRWCITFYFVSMMWMLFRSSSWEDFQRFRWHLKVDHSGYFSSDFAKCFRIPGVNLVMQHLPVQVSDPAVQIVCAVLFLGACFVICLCLPNNQKRQYRVNAGTLLATAAMLLVSLLSMSGVSNFIYNDF